MSKAVTVAVWLGVGALIAAAAIIGGIVVNVLNDGENHKEAMMQSPPPAPPPVRRAMQDELYTKGNHFELTKAERALFSTLAHRERANAKLHR
jgi:hypothetical protein